MGHRVADRASETLSKANLVSSLDWVNTGFAGMGLKKNSTSEVRVLVAILCRHKISSFSRTYS